MTAAVPGALNFRDVGGLPAAGGRTRSGVLYRSGDLSRLDGDGRAVLQGLGVRHVIDLRSDDEVARAPSRLEGVGIAVHRVPLFLGSAASFFVDDVSLTELYRHLVDGAQGRIVEVVRGVLGGAPVVVHCTVGKDRTGVTVALTLAAAGVDLDAIVADYARTETLLPVQYTRAVVSFLRAQHPEAVHLEELAARSPATAMWELLDDLSRRFGSPTDYLRAGGLRDDEITALRSVLIEG